ncbi:DUF5694 domain-containing protein [Massilia terrae]|uniref:DUF5694 domain-containing protein n=1 Tax=Massilia terrae TaxID=1811224 RepID=A0ABT2CZR9_9BURK|nr:DUF5694 domain-containing protein [Massilia terrae]MCS0658583.1 DUF5694 domain-containing protein [Massilia terrae]
MMRPLLGLLLVATFCAANAQTSTYDTASVFDPSKLKGPARGTPNEVMVLGTAHLSQLPRVFDPASLDGLLDRLANWHPQIIAIESMSGTLCASMRQYPDRYADTVKTYCWDPTPARAATGLDVPAATREIDAMLAHWPVAPTSAQRRKLASHFLAGGEPASALVQWLRLPEAERHAGDGLDASLVALLEKFHTWHKEDGLIAAPLAARLGLERVVPMDDQSENLPVDDEKAYGDAIAKAWDNPANAKRTRVGTELDAGVGSAAGVMALYRALNDRSLARTVFDADFGAALEEPSGQGYGRVYVGYWETRNLRMAANIREAIGAHPGRRTLVIVGASHKWYLQAYLNQMHDVHIVDIAPMLR